MNKEKKLGLLLISAIYLLAFAIGYIPYHYLAAMSINPIYSTFVFTLTATFVIYIFCLIYKNTSIYDPYWSVAPLVMVLLHMIRYQYYNLTSLIFVILILIYSVRLTLNWAITYKGIDPKYEDWRYKKYRQKKPWLFHIINFFGLIYIPTIVVYASLLPGLFIMTIYEFNPLIIIGFVFMLAGPVLEFFADHQSHKFIKECDDHTKVCNLGLWNYSRHPNYLGELMFWFGIAVSFYVTMYSYWVYGFGFILMLALFLFISIPLMEKHNIEKRPSYVEYKKHTSMLLILSRRK